MPSQEGEPPPAEQADKGADAATQPAVGDIPPSEEGQGGAGSGTAPQSGRKVEGAPGTAGQTGRSQGATQRSVAGTARGGADNEGPPPPEEPGLLDGLRGWVDEVVHSWNRRELYVNAEIDPSELSSDTFQTITAALEKAQDTDRINIFPGEYIESLDISSLDDIELVGQGEAKQIILRNVGREPGIKVVAKTRFRLANVTVEATPPDEKTKINAVDIMQGTRCLVEDCILSCDGGAGLFVHGEEDDVATRVVARSTHFSRSNWGVRVNDKAEMNIDGCTFTICREAGIQAEDGAQVIIENNKLFENTIGIVALGAEDATKQTKLEANNNQIYENTNHGALVSQHAEADFKYNDLYESLGTGLAYTKESKGLVKGNTIKKNAKAGLEIAFKANPEVVENTFVDCDQGCGVFVHKDGIGQICDNRFKNNYLAAIITQSGGDPSFERNYITNTERHSVVCENKGKGQFTDNKMHGATLAGVSVTTEASPTFTGNVICDNLKGGVFVDTKGYGKFVNNIISDNVSAGVEVINGGDPEFTGNKIHSNKAGVYVHDDGKGLFENNEVFENQFGGFEIQKGGDPTLKENTIHSGTTTGVSVHSAGKGTLIRNTIRDNTWSNVLVRGAGDPLLQFNNIYGSARDGIQIYEGGRGRYEDNRVHDNNGFEINVYDNLEEAATPLLLRNEVYKTEPSGHDIGIMVSNKSRAKLHGNKIRNCPSVGLYVKEFSNVTATANEFYNNGVGAIVTTEKSVRPREEELIGSSTFEDYNEFFNNSVGLKVSDRAEAIVKNARFIRNGTGVLVDQGAKPSLEKINAFDNRSAGVTITGKRSNPKLTDCEIQGPQLKRPFRKLILDEENSADKEITFRGNTFGANEEVKITIDKTKQTAEIDMFIIEVNGDSLIGYPKELKEEESMGKEIKFVATYNTRLWATLPEVEDNQKKEWIFKGQDSTYFTTTPIKSEIKDKKVPPISDVYLGPDLLIGKWNGDSIDPEKPVPTTLDETHDVYYPDFGVFHNAIEPGPALGEPVLANGVLVTDAGLGNFEKCKIHHAPLTGMAINTMGCPTVTDCKIFLNGLHGISMEAEGRGSIERNEIYENAENGFDISDGSNAVMRENKVFKNEKIGACFHDSAKGIFELNKVYESEFCGVEIKEGTKLAGFELWGGSETKCPRNVWTAKLTVEGLAAAAKEGTKVTQGKTVGFLVKDVKAGASSLEVHCGPGRHAPLTDDAPTFKVTVEGEVPEVTVAGQAPKACSEATPTCVQEPADELANEIDRYNDYFVPKPKRTIPKPQKDYWKKNYGDDMKFTEGYENGWGEKWEYNRPTGRTLGTLPPASAPEIRKGATAYTKRDKGLHVPVEGMQWEIQRGKDDDGEDFFPAAPPVFHKAHTATEFGMPTKYPDADQLGMSGLGDNVDTYPDYYYDEKKEDEEENAEDAQPSDPGPAEGSEAAPDFDAPPLPAEVES